MPISITIRICALLLVSLAPSLRSQTPAPAVSFVQPVITGMWQAESTPPGTTWTAVLRVDGPRVVGAVSSCASNRAEIEIYDGSIDGNTLTYKCRSLDGDRTLTFTGTITDDDIAFTWTKQVQDGGRPYA